LLFLLDGLALLGRDKGHLADLFLIDASKLGRVVTAAGGIRADLHAYYMIANYRCITGAIL
jgi:hypothetical protein